MFGGVLAMIHSIDLSSVHKIVSRPVGYGQGCEIRVLRFFKLQRFYVF